MKNYQEIEMTLQVEEGGNLHQELCKYFSKEIEDQLNQWGNIEYDVTVEGLVTREKTVYYMPNGDPGYPGSIEVDIKDVFILIPHTPKTINKDQSGINVVTYGQTTWTNISVLNLLSDKEMDIIDTYFYENTEWRYV